MAFRAGRLVTRSLNSSLLPSPRWLSIPPKFTLPLGGVSVRRTRYLVFPAVRATNTNFSLLAVSLRNMSTSAQPDERNGVGDDETGHGMTSEEFSTYNAFSEKMNNFVCLPTSPLCPCILNKTRKFTNTAENEPHESTSTSAQNGNRSKPPAKTNAH